MAFPFIISGSITPSEDSDVTTHTVALPTTVPSNKLLFIIAGNDGLPTVTPPTGFTVVKSTTVSGSAGYWAKITNGTEGGTSVTYDTDVAERSAHMSFLVDGWGGSIANDIFVSDGVLANAITHDPDSVTAPWGSADNLFIAALNLAKSVTNGSISSYPANYTDNQTNVYSTPPSTSGAEVLMATRNLAAASDDPGIFTLTEAGNGTALTIVIKPATAAPAPTISDINTDEIIAHGEAFTLTGTDLPDGSGSSAVTLSPSNSISDPNAVVQTGITWTSATSLSGTGMNYIGTGIAKGGTGYVFVTNATGTSNTTGFQITRQDDAPTILSSVIDTLGTSLTMTADEAITIGVGGSGGFTLSTGETLTYSSGSGSATVVYSISPAVEGGTSPTLAYTQPTDGWEDGTGDDLATFSGASITNNSTVDTTAPVPTSPTAGSVTNVSVTPSFTANENTGTAYVVLVPDGDVPSVAQIKLGQQSSGAAAIAADSDPISATGIHTFAAMTGLTGNTAYELYFVHTDASNNDSAAITVGFTTQSATATVSGIVGGLNLTALAYTVFAGYNIGTSTILKQGTGETTDGSGNLTIPLDDTAAGDGDPVTIVIADYTTTPTAASSGAVCYTSVSVA